MTIDRTIRDNLVTCKKYFVYVSEYNDATIFKKQHSYSKKGENMDFYIKFRLTSQNCENILLLFDSSGSNMRTTIFMMLIKACSCRVEPQLHYDTSNVTRDQKLVKLEVLT